MGKEIDINNEEEILKECDFDYFYESENCSRELCMFYNDIQHKNADFNCKQAYIDLGRIAITLNKQAQRIAELEEQLKNSIRPKFKVNDRIFVIVNNEVEEYYVDEVLLKVKGTLVAYRDICKQTTITEKNEIFPTKEEALKKLEELQGENK